MIFKNGESVNLADRVSSSRILKPQEKLILGILMGGRTTVEELMVCVMSEPYNLTCDEAVKNLDELREKGLIEIAKFRKNNSRTMVDTLITYVSDYMNKL